MNGRSMPLGFIQTGREVVVKEMLGGKGMCRRLAGLGITRGAVVRVVKNDICGPVIVLVKEARLALGRGITQKIMVEEK